MSIGTPMFFFSLLLAAATPLTADATGLDARIGSAVTKTVQAQHPVGAAVGVAKDGKLIYVAAFGKRDLATGAPVDAGTRFEIGSVTKQFTAAAILQLQDRGKLSINDRLSAYFPAFPHAADITLKELLYQISGLPDYLTEKDTAKSFETPATLDFVASRVTNLRFAPGSKWEYSNTNYFLLGNVVAKVSGETYERYVRENLFDPVGMTRSAFVEDEPGLTDVAKSYWRGDDGKSKLTLAPEIPESWAGGAGAIISTIADLVKWDTALASGKVVSAADYALMSTPGRLNDGSPTQYGMGLGINPLLAHKRIWHNGGTLGSFTMNGTYPDDHIDIVVFENSDDGDPANVEVSALGAIFPEALAASKRAAPGEDLSFRPRILHYLDETLKGTMPESEMSAEFAHVATPQTQHRFATMFAPFGKPTAVIFRGTRRRGDATMYSYRVEFAKHAIMFLIAYNWKTKLVDGIGLQPAP